MSLEINIHLSCDECGSDLDYTLGSTQECDIELIVFPCKECYPSCRREDE